MNEKDPKKISQVKSESPRETAASAGNQAPKFIDKNGKVTNVPEEGFDHSLDAIRYALAGFKNTDNEVEYDYSKLMKGLI